MSFNNEYLYMIEDVAENMASAGSVSSLVSILSYVFISLAMYTIAQRRGIRKAWLAWVPVVNVWILGSISDQYRYVVKGEVKNKRKVLLTLSILNTVLAWVAVIKMIVSLVLAVSGMAQHVDEMELVRLALSSLVWFIPVAILSILGLVLEILALYDVYKSCEPDNSVLYLVLSLIPGIEQITQPVFLFLCRNKDEGMPPRRESVPEENAEI